MDAELIRAAAENCPATVAKLLVAGADANAVCRDGNTALIYAAIYNRPLVATLLLGQKAADRNAQAAKYDGMTALLIAARLDNLSVMNLLLSDAATDVAAVDDQGRSALAVAVEFGAVKAAAVLLSCARVSVSARDRAGNTALMVALEHDEKDEIAPMMIMILAAENRHDVLVAANDEGATPLLQAVIHRREWALAMLLEIVPGVAHKACGQVALVAALAVDRPASDATIEHLLIRRGATLPAGHPELEERYRAAAAAAF